MSPAVYDTLYKPDPAIVAAELRQLTEALHATIDKASKWLLRRFPPNGPIMTVQNLSYVYKTLWGLHTCGYRAESARLMDWVRDECLTSSGDMFFVGEPPAERDGTRGYRQMTVLRCAAESGHSLARDEMVIRRAYQYQSERCGGVYAYIGDDPGQPVFPDDCNVGDTVFFGEVCLALKDRERVLDVADWLLSVVEQNELAMQDGLFYWHTDDAGALITQTTESDRVERVLDRSVPNQFGWVLGAAMAFLADVHHACLDWALGDDVADRYLAAALQLLRFESSWPLESYFFPSKCKVAWGAGRLLSILAMKDPLLYRDEIDLAYRAGRRTYIYTFLGNRRPDGAWGEVFYPVDAAAAEMWFDYRVLEGRSAIDVVGRRANSTTSVALNDVEITGEFLAELEHLRRGIWQLPTVVMQLSEAINATA